MRPNAAELSLRRRMVFHGLKAHLPAGSVRNALALCDGEFSSEATFSVTRFLTRLGQVDPSVGQPVKYFEYLQKLRNVPPEQIGPDPLGYSWDTPAAPAATPKSEANGTWTGTANALLHELITAFNQAKPGLGDTLKKRSPGFPAGTAKDKLHAGLHAMYVWACEEVGPVLADKLFARAVKAVEVQAGAAQYPPQALL
jgi:hypothetical protein